LALPGSVDKYRYLVPLEGTDLTVEVDEFLGDNEGLVVAEIELESETQSFPMPDYLGQDVTYDPRYLNSYLATHPFHTWRSRENNTKNA
ncbi:MAG: adenylate cyclase, partial [Paludibacteraceae bacterium]|nr:adenylate cyclase [Paludibacteraceae bacterium]